MAAEVIIDLLDISTGIGDDEMEKELIIYPNPAVEVINITTSQFESGEVELTIINLSGKIVYRNNFADLSTGTLLVPVNELSSGIYYIRLVTPEGINTSKFVVRK